MIKGKSAIVTGSTSGIGLGIATALAEQGCNLLINGFVVPPNGTVTLGAGYTNCVAGLYQLQLHGECGGHRPRHSRHRQSH